ncbi:hypothetical protein K435DRAFT_796424 [Dendrothele bispora CBS 962.96]|uniref:Uncharacterized protein n=1 Tax=Dendrothele bispora (strain CBS 962.96) TaxID=1314807 RepID=A0A4S8M6A5_DENBC|nr:hypothetical protein K435DRAFT_796424 [Dendrothele bispora CBS 962.96]
MVMDVTVEIVVLKQLHLSSSMNQETSEMGTVGIESQEALILKIVELGLIWRLVWIHGLVDIEEDYLLSMPKALVVTAEDLYWNASYKLQSSFENGPLGSFNLQSGISTTALSSLANNFLLFSARDKLMIRFDKLTHNKEYCPVVTLSSFILPILIEDK